VILAVPPDDKTITVILLDIEGTTTPVDFVYHVLFPFARDHVGEFIEENPEAVRADIEHLRAEHEADLKRGLKPPSWAGESPSSQVKSVVGYVHWLMDQDRKATALKSLQGKIWQRGYQTGALHSQVYEDVPRAFARWQSQKKAISIYSSGSVLAQKLLFAHTVEGDLTGYISNYFDTNVGPKTSAESYRSIATNLQVPGSEILFVSDVTAELDSAQSAALQAALCVRAGHAEPMASRAFPVIRTFDEILPSDTKH
jgi:enolase-phosphatase E1